VTAQLSINYTVRRKKKILKNGILPFKNTKNILNGQAENENKMFGVLTYLF